MKRRIRSLHEAVVVVAVGALEEEGDEVAEEGTLGAAEGITAKDSRNMKKTFLSYQLDLKSNNNKE
jgi:hypothetical protein